MNFEHWVLSHCGPVAFLLIKGFFFQFSILCTKKNTSALQNSGQIDKFKIILNKMALHSRWVMNFSAFLRFYSHLCYILIPCRRCFYHTKLLLRQAFNMQLFEKMIRAKQDKIRILLWVQREMQRCCCELLLNGIIKEHQKHNNDVETNE